MNPAPVSPDWVRGLARDLVVLPDLTFGRAIVQTVKALEALAAWMQSDPCADVHAELRQCVMVRDALHAEYERAIAEIAAARGVSR